VGLTPAQWETLSIIVNLPGFSPATAVLLAKLHGIMGRFPHIVRLKPAGGCFEVAELINLQELRNRERAVKKSAG